MSTSTRSSRMNIEVNVDVGDGIEIGEEENMEMINSISQDSSVALDKPPKKRKDSSVVWEHFTKIVVQGQDIKAQCKHCGSIFMADPIKHGTSSMKKHVDKCKELNKKKGGMDNYILSYDGEGNKNQLKQHKFEAKHVRENLVSWIICDELPFMLVESPRFKDFCKSMEPRFDVPSRVTIARDMFKLYKAQKEKLKEDLNASVGRVSLTTDMWTSSNNASYMCVTAHFIDKSWQLHKRIISFAMVDDHTGNGIGMQLEHVLNEWGIKKIMCITVDNASANDAAVDWIKSFGTKNLLGGEHLHVRCFAHILNLIVRYGLAKCNDGIERIRNAVKYVRSSPKRLSHFNQCAMNAGVMSTKSLCLDVATRWNSTFLMLEVAVEYQRAFDRLRGEDIGYNNALQSGKVKGTPTCEDWDDARNLIPFLEPFYTATTEISGSLYLTITSYFSEFKSIRDHLIAAQEDSHFLISEIATEMLKKYNSYFGNAKKLNKLIFVALVLDPRSKMEILKRGLIKAFQGHPEVAEELLNGTKKLLQDLYECYFEAQPSHVPQAQASKIPSSSSTSTSTSNSTRKMSKSKRLWEQVCDESELDTPTERSELERYLTEDREVSREDFDLLHYWKVMQGRFPTLASIARDVFAIPASTVASESAFSTGGRVITDRRSSLLPRTVEALICTQSWMKNVLVIGGDEVILEDDVAEEVERAAGEEFDVRVGIAGSSHSQHESFES